MQRQKEYKDQAACIHTVASEQFFSPPPFAVYKFMQPPRKALYRVCVMSL